MGAIKTIIKQIGLIVRSVVKLMTFCIIVGICVFVYARYIEPELLTINEVNVTAQSLQLGDSLKIVQCSDLHVGPDYDMDHLARVVKKINALNPDLIVFTGDLIDNNKSFKQVDETIAILSELKATFGKYAVAGNHDYGGNGFKNYSKIMKNSGFKLLINESSAVTLASGAAINIIGLDDAVWGKVDLQEAMAGIKSKDFNIVLCHEPDLADEVAKYPVDLQLSGHSHGGQVRVPFKGAILTPPKGHKYIKGMYEMTDNPRMKLYVNVGIGTSQQRFRFACVPELTVITLN
nr:metallophosphoesterase [uncultured Cellulosilyticum sp.]